MSGRFADRLGRRAFLKKAITRTAAVAGTAWLGSQLEWWRPLVGQSAGSTLAGRVHHVLSERPIAGATIAIAGPTSTVATTEQNGRYQVMLPPGHYELWATAPGFLGVAASAEVTADGEARVDFAMLPANPTAKEQETIHEKVVKEPGGPAQKGPPAAAAASGPTATVVVPDTIWVQLSDGSIVQMGMDDYLRHVVPAEMPASWPTEALKAQAVAARTYATAWGATPSHPICTDTRCQVYGDYTYASTDQAVWATHGQVMTYNGGVISALYFSRCNGITTKNSENAIDWRYCSQLGWNAVAYLRARSCTGHAPFSGWVGSTYYPSSCGYYGHGVGMCQVGAYYRANSGLNYTQILESYYTGIQVTSGTSQPPQLVAPANGWLQLASSPITLRWSGASSLYQVTLVYPNNSVQTSGWLTGTSYTLTLPAGGYSWYVTGQSGGVSDGQSATWRFTLASQLYQQSLSGVIKQ